VVVGSNPATPTIFINELQSYPLRLITLLGD